MDEGIEILVEGGLVGLRGRWSDGAKKESGGGVGKGMG